MEGECKKPGLRELLQALVDGKEVRNTSSLAGGWWSLDTYRTHMQSKGFFIDPSDHHEIRDKVRPHPHAEIIKVWVENPEAYRVELLSEGRWLPFSDHPAWTPGRGYRLLDAKTGEYVTVSGAKP